MRRAYLCGQHPLTGADYEHRRKLIRQRMEFLVGITGVEVLGYAVMPENLQPLFERLGISTEMWVDCVVNFHKWFRSSVGHPKSMESAAEAKGHNRAISIDSTRRASTAT